MKKNKNLKLRLRREYQISGARVIQTHLKSRRDDTMAAKSISYRCSCFKLCFGSRLLTRVECVAARLRLFSCGSHDWFLRASITKPKATTLLCDEVRFAVASGSAWITSTFIWPSAALWDEFSNGGIEIIVCAVFIRGDQCDRLLLYCPLAAVDNISGRANI